MMSLYSQFKDYFMIGGHGALAGISIILMLIFIVFYALLYPERLSNFSLFFQWYWYVQRIIILNFWILMEEKWVLRVGHS